MKLRRLIPAVILLSFLCVPAVPAGAAVKDFHFLEVRVDIAVSNSAAASLGPRSGCPRSWTARTVRGTQAWTTSPLKTKAARF
jgi:hypothetical protein